MRFVALARPRRWLANSLALTMAATVVAGCGANDPRQTDTPEARERVQSHAVFRVTTGRPLVALTFDDGPDPRWTPAVLGLLGGRAGRATFFLVGRSALAHPDLVQAELAGGDEIGNHTLTHAHLEFLTPAGVQAEVAGGSRAIVAAGAPRPLLFRPPRGFTTKVVARAAARAREQTVFWGLTVERFIGRRGAVADGVSRLLARMRPGTVVLAHDGGMDRSRTLQALPLLLDGLAARGYRLVTLSELLASGPGASL